MQRRGPAEKSRRNKFLLTHPLRGATGLHNNGDVDYEISTHTPLAGCNIDNPSNTVLTSISTHTPLAGCNLFSVDWIYHVKISTHTPLAGCNSSGGSSSDSLYTFLLTHPLRGATEMLHTIIIWKCISTHTPLAGCNKFPVPRHKDEIISTHTPLAGCNCYEIHCKCKFWHFYSHTPCGVQQWGVYNQ